MFLKNINTPVTTSAGRLFDAVASLIGLRLFDSLEDFYLESKDYYEKQGWNFVYTNEGLKLLYHRKEGRKNIYKTVSIDYSPTTEDWSSENGIGINKKPFYLFVFQSVLY